MGTSREQKINLLQDNTEKWPKNLVPTTIHHRCVIFEDELPVREQLCISAEESPFVYGHNRLRFRVPTPVVVETHHFLSFFGGENVKIDCENRSKVPLALGAIFNRNCLRIFWPKICGYCLHKWGKKPKKRETEKECVFG